MIAEVLGPKHQESQRTNTESLFGSSFLSPSGISLVVRAPHSASLRNHVHALTEFHPMGDVSSTGTDDTTPFAQAHLKTKHCKPVDGTV